MSAIALKHTASKRSGSRNYVMAGLATAGALAYFYNQNNKKRNTAKAALFGAASVSHVASIPSGQDFKAYQQVYNDIADKVRDEDDADQGAGRYGLLVRLAWHTSGTYTKKTNTGGSYSGTMIYSPESSDGGNAGLETGRDFLVEFNSKYPWISRGDLWTLAGVVAVQEAGGPKIKWRPGRVDQTNKAEIPKNGLLPDASQGASHVRSVFTRMGFTDQETVALIGAHCLGRCHTWRSGFDGPWGPSPNMFTNDFFVRLMQNWSIRKWDGPTQYEDDETKSFMMLPSDIALKDDKNFLKYVKIYAADEGKFFTDFSNAFTKLLENGVAYPKGAEHWEFQTLDEQDSD